jgi:hypothetical protein
MISWFKKYYSSSAFSSCVLISLGGISSSHSIGPSIVSSLCLYLVNCHFFPPNNDNNFAFSSATQTPHFQDPFSIYLALCSIFHLGIYCNRKNDKPLFCISSYHLLSLLELPSILSFSLSIRRHLNAMPF